MTIKIFLLIVLSEMCSAATHILFKKGVNDLQSYNMRNINDYLLFIKNVLEAPYIWYGFLMVAFSMAIWLIVLAHAELSLVFPFDSTQYIMILLASYFFLGEGINWTRILGTACIVTGIILIVLS